MLHDVVAVDTLGNYRLRVRFDDGVEGVVNVKQIVALDGVFHALRDLTFFGRVRVHAELGVVSWPNGADLDSDVLYRLVTTGVNLAVGRSL